MKPASKKCEKCDANAERGGRFCGPHRKEVLAELRASGYLTETKVAAASDMIGRRLATSAATFGGSAEMVSHDDEE